MGRDLVMIFGLGDLGGHVLEFLARVPNVPKIVAADINEDWGIRKTNCAIGGASQFGLYPNIEFIKLDAFDIDRTATVLKEIQPSIIYNSMTLQSWWVITRLPQDAYKAIDEAHYAPWYPMHFVPVYKMMQAVKRSGIKTHVVNAAFPDLVNPALAKIGLAPTVGVVAPLPLWVAATPIPLPAGHTWAAASSARAAPATATDGSSAIPGPWSSSSACIQSRPAATTARWTTSSR